MQSKLCEPMVMWMARQQRRRVARGRSGDTWLTYA
jgi:hypothetical protein